MSIQIRYVKDPSNLNKERVVLRAESDDDIGRYLLFDTTYIDTTQVSNKVRHSYWFPDQQVKKGDVIVVYTKIGENTIHENTDGSKSYFFYIGLKETIWNTDGDCAVLLEIANWKFKRLLPVQPA